MVPFNQTGCQGHGGQGHGNAVSLFREQLLSHHGPGRTTGCGHERKLFRYLLHEVNSLLGGAQVGAHSHLKNIGKSQRLHGRTQFARRHLLAELSHECGRHGSIHTLAGLDGADDLEYLGLVRNGPKGAVHKAHAAGYTFIIINIRLAVFI